MKELLWWGITLISSVASFLYVCNRGEPKLENLSSAKILWVVLSALPGVQVVMLFFGVTAALAAALVIPRFRRR